MGKGKGHVAMTSERYMCWMFLNHLITFIIINHMINLRTSALIN